MKTILIKLQFYHNRNFRFDLRLKQWEKKVYDKINAVGFK